MFLGGSGTHYFVKKPNRDYEIEKPSFKALEGEHARQFSSANTPCDPKFLNTKPRFHIYLSQEIHLTLFG